MNQKVLTEAVVVGILLAISGILLIKKFNFVSLFLLGFGFHLVCEITGINRWYCKHGAACLR